LTSNLHPSTGTGGVSGTSYGTSYGTSMNMEAAQLVVGAAILDPRFRQELLENRGKALRAVDRLAVAPAHVRLTAGDRRALSAIRATDLQEFAVGVERLRRTIRPGRSARSVSPEASLVG
jgi:hypothetical protein